MDDFDIDQLAAEGASESFTEEAKALMKRHGLQSCFIAATTIGDKEYSTRAIYGRSGNYYATYGAIRQWLIDEDAQMDEVGRRKVDDV